MSSGGSTGQRRRPSFPSGTVTFMLTDLVGSTHLAEALGRKYGEVLGRHHALLRTAFQRCGGVEVKELGDGFIAAFRSAGPALACAVQCQQALAEADWATGDQLLRIRMALHTADVEAKRGEYHGLALAHAHRLLEAGHGGQILCSEAASALLRRELPPGVVLVDLGNYHLRGLQGTERVFQVSYAGMEPDEFPPLRTEGGSPGWDLPVSLTGFVGRSAELEWLRDALLSDGVRLVTLLGPGGIGKSRLAIEGVRRLIALYPGVAWFVPLQDLPDASLIPRAIADAVKLPYQPSGDPLSQVSAALSRRPALLILDNFENLIEGGPTTVRTLLENVPTLKCLVTSREALGLMGEIEYQVPPLPTPEAAADVEALGRCESVQLFPDRARAARPGFQLTAGNAPAIAQLCHRLDGIPLAIELAAARIQVLTPEQMVSQLDDRFGFLVGHKRDVPARHQTLRAAIDWSFQALAPEVQALFAKLAVFRGGFTVAAAKTVCDERHAAEVLELLCARSMVGPAEADEDSGEIRFRLSETFRDYGWQQLDDAERDAVSQRHAEYYLEVAEQAERRLGGGRHAYWLKVLDREHENLRAALTWFEDHPGSEEGGPRLVGALWELWQTRGYLSEARTHLAAVLRGEPKRTEARARALDQAGWLASVQGDYDTARARFEEALTMAREAGLATQIARTCLSLAAQALVRDDCEAARRLVAEAMAVASGRQDTQLRAEVLLTASEVDTCAGLYQQASEHATEARGIFARLGDRLAEAYCLTRRGVATLGMGETAQARADLCEALRALLEAADRTTIGWNLTELARVEVTEGRPARAAVLLAASEALRAATHTTLTPAERAQYEAALDCARDQIDADRLDAEWQAGMSMDWEEAVAFALSPERDTAR